VVSDTIYEDYVVDRISIRAIKGDHCSKPLVEGRWYEPRLLERVRSLGLGGTSIDVGAFVGNHSTFFATKTAADCVVAIEPNHKAAGALHYNAEKHKFLYFSDVIVGPAQADKWFKRVEGPAGNAGMTRFEEGPGHVRGSTLFSIVSERAFQPVTVIKIDVEGSAPEILNDPQLIDWLQTNSPHFFIEANTRPEQAAINRLLGQAGYQRDPRNLASTPTYHWFKA
jgi:FkbM family methyltransferase